MNFKVPVKRSKVGKRSRSGRKATTNVTVYEVTKGEGADSAKLKVTSKHGEFNYLIPSAPIEV